MPTETIRKATHCSRQGWKHKMVSQMWLVYASVHHSSFLENKYTETKQSEDLTSATRALLDTQCLDFQKWKGSCFFFFFKLREWLNHTWKQKMCKHKSGVSPALLMNLTINSKLLMPLCHVTVRGTSSEHTLIASLMAFELFYHYFIWDTIWKIFSRDIDN